MRVPSFMLKKLYVDESLSPADGGGFTFQLKNTLATATIVGPPEIQIDGQPVNVSFSTEEESAEAEDISEDDPYKLEKGVVVTVSSDDEIDEGAHAIQIKTPTKEWDTLEFEVEDTL